MDNVKAGTFEISGPVAQCSECRFLVSLDGEFSVEGGRLVWRSNPDIQPQRGPDLDSCCESSPVVEFDRVTADGKKLTRQQAEELRETMRTERVQWWS